MVRVQAPTGGTGASCEAPGCVAETLTVAAVAPR